MTSFDALGGIGAPATRPQLLGDEPRVREPLPAAGRSFGAALAGALEGVDDLQDEAARKAEALARGEPVQLHDLLISMEESSVAFHLMLEVRNKLLDAWEALNRIPV